jgi:mannose-6-phosphate isomerase class I
MTEIPLYPLRFEPIYQYRLWGGRRLAQLLSAPLPGDGPIGEAWILTDRDDHRSLVANGPLRGKNLQELIKQFPEEMLGKLAGHSHRFPLLLKFLDVSKTLSVQVHPPDAYKELIPPGETGKTEAWVVLQTGPEARIYAGLKPGATAEVLHRAITNGTVSEQLAHFSPKVGDAVLIPAGTAHALSDVVVFEVQENSDVTFRLFDWNHVEISLDQSALTGESLPATRKPGEAVFSGSIVRRGEIGAMVYATGTKTYFGKTAQLVETAVTVSHFQKALLKIGNYLIVLAAVLVAVIITVAIFRGDPILDTLQFALVLTVAAIPVAMPTVLSVTMAVGARLLAKKQAVVSKLVAIEELAGVDIICADKTGTLTQNKLTLGDPFCVNGIPADQVILDGALASRSDNNDTIDLAVIGGLKNKDATKNFQVTHFTPFDPVHKRTEASVKDKDGKEFKVTKGAPQVIMQLSTNAEQVKSAVDKAVNEFAARGFRALGVARAEGDGSWQFVGILPLFDPPRVDAKETIATALKMGVKVKMVTGDALAIAKETAKKLDLGTNIPP